MVGTFSNCYLIQVTGYIRGRLVGTGKYIMRGTESGHSIRHVFDAMDQFLGKKYDKNRLGIIIVPFKLSVQGQQ